MENHVLQLGSEMKCGLNVHWILNQIKTSFIKVNYYKTCYWETLVSYIVHCIKDKPIDFDPSKKSQCSSQWCKNFKKREGLSNRRRTNKKDKSVWEKLHMIHGYHAYVQSAHISVKSLWGHILWIPFKIHKSKIRIKIWGDTKCVFKKFHQKKKSHLQAMRYQVLVRRNLHLKRSHRKNHE